MATVPSSEPIELHNGDRMTQKEFHRLYEQTPEGFKAELIGGIVHVPSPLELRHSKNHFPLGAVILGYENATLGTESGDNTTILLGEEGEPQPDLFLRILPEFGGQSRTTDDYVDGAPELIGEIANSSRSIDLHAKRADYVRYGVREYLVVCLREAELRWFDLHANEELKPDPDGIYRVRVFPGLWIDREALFARDLRRLLATLDRGLATLEHAAFVQRLAAVRQS
jgi:Uma2 family endonuclease